MTHICVIVTKYLTTHRQGDGIYGTRGPGVSVHHSSEGMMVNAVTLHMAAEQVAAASHMSVEHAQILRLGHEIFWPTPIN